MTAERRNKGLSKSNKPFDRKALRKSRFYGKGEIIPTDVKAIQLVKKGKKSMMTCKCGSKLFNKDTLECYRCGTANN